jgi:hypothetical protein
MLLLLYGFHLKGLNRGEPNLSQRLTMTQLTPRMAVIVM